MTIIVITWLYLAFLMLYTCVVLGIGGLIVAILLGGGTPDPEPPPAEPLTREEKKALKKLAPIDNKYR